MRVTNPFLLRAGVSSLAIVLFVSTGMLAAAQAAAPAAVASVGNLKPIMLPAPQTAGKMTLMQALANRHTTRAFAVKPLPLQMLSNLLWAGDGINRPVAKTAPAGPGVGRTAPSGHNLQDVEMYVVLPEGVYNYDAVKNVLVPKVAGDQRAKISSAAAVHAPVTVVLVAPAKAELSQVDSGLIGQNLLLFAASEQLNAWFYAFHRPGIGEALGLDANREPLYGVSVGFPE